MKENHILEKNRSSLIGSGIYIFNEKTKKLKYFSYTNNLENEDKKNLKEKERFVKLHKNDLTYTMEEI